MALDIPSGAPADGGALAGPAVRASLTATFAGLKRGLVMGPAVELAGRVEVVPIGVPQAEVERGIETFVLEREDVAAHNPPRPREAHKGDYGRLLVVAGSRGKTGAAALAARAAMRSGAGLVTVASPASQQPVVAALVLEAMTEPLPETAAHTVSAKAAPLIDTANGGSGVAYPETLARAIGVAECDPASLITERRRRQLEFPAARARVARGVSARRPAARPRRAG